MYRQVRYFTELCLLSNTVVKLTVPACIHFILWTANAKLLFATWWAEQVISDLLSILFVEQYNKLIIQYGSFSFSHLFKFLHFKSI